MSFSQEKRSLYAENSEKILFFVKVYSPPPYHFLRPLEGLESPQNLSPYAHISNITVL